MEDEAMVPGGMQAEDDPAPGEVAPPPGHTPIAHIQEGLPTWEEAHGKIIHTIRHIPKPAREEWARTLGATVGDVLADITNPAKWLLLYIVARCVLSARPPELGAAGRKTGHRIKEACRRWRAGEAAALWKEATGEVGVQARRGRRRRPREHEPSQEERNARRCATLVQEGQLSRAARALVSRGMDQTSAQALQEMVDKHPRGAALSGEGRSRSRPRPSTPSLSPPGKCSSPSGASSLAPPQAPLALEAST